MKCPNCHEEIEITMLGDPTDYQKGMGKLTAESKMNRIWDTAARLAENAQYFVPAKSRTKEKLLELFKYYLKELMQSEGN
jgi:hypothetical protein